MGMFLVAPIEREVNVRKLKQLATKKGLNNYKKIDLEAFSIFTFFNDLKVHDSFSMKGCEIFSFGTFIYKQKSKQDALKLYINDYIDSKVENNAVYGEFTLIVTFNNKINIIRDNSSIADVFGLLDEMIFSNSFLALIYSTGRKWTFNKQSIRENITIGYILKPNTIVNEISLVEKSFTFKNLIFSGFYEKPNYTSTDKIKGNNLLKKITATLNRDYSIIANAFANDFLDIGLSGGYDSRLNLALASNYFKISPHSHFKEVKDHDLDIAKSLCKSLNLTLKTKQIKPALSIQSEEELYILLDDTFHYYDGRTMLNTGFFNEIYSQSYRNHILDGANLTLTGFGGEIFRNFDFQPTAKIDFDVWLHNFVMNYYKFSAIIDGLEKDGFLSKLKSSLIEKLDLKTKRISFRDRKCYFYKVWSPTTYSLKSYTENQLSYFLSPFISNSIKIFGEDITNELSKNWNFQSQLVNEISPSLAQIRSSYGYSFNEKAYLYGLKNKIKNNHIVLPIKNYFQHKEFLKKINNNQVVKNDIFDEIYNYLNPYIEGFVDERYIKTSINWYYNALSIALSIKKIKIHNETL